MKSTVVWASATDEWETPDRVFAPLQAEFQCDLDVAATNDNYKIKPFLSPEDDALAVDWRGYYDGPAPICWMNPPYSQIAAFMRKAWGESQKGCTVVCLVPSRTDTRWWHEYVWDVARNAARPWAEIRYIKGRVKFGAAPSGAPFPSVVIIFRPVEVVEWP